MYVLLVYNMREHIVDNEPEIINVMVEKIGSMDECIAELKDSIDFRTGWEVEVGKKTVNLYQVYNEGTRAQYKRIKMYVIKKGNNDMVDIKL